MDEYKNMFKMTTSTTRTKTTEIVTEKGKTYQVTTTVEKRELTSAEVTKRKEKLQAELTKLEDIQLVQEKAISDEVAAK